MKLTTEFDDMIEICDDCDFGLVDIRVAGRTVSVSRSESIKIINHLMKVYVIDSAELVGSVK